MNKSTRKLGKLKRSLNKNPKMPGINGFWNFKFLDKRAGMRDSSQNQICEQGEGYTTPHINEKTHLYASYIDKMYLKTSLNLEPFVTEASALAVEFNLLHRKKEVPVQGKSENARRYAAFQAENVLKAEKRKVEILTRIAEIKAESDMVDESLMHHIERAEGIFRSRISRYWSGVLVSSEDRLDYFPYVEKREYEGREKYLENRRKVVAIIDEVIVKGGASHE